MSSIDDAIIGSPFTGIAGQVSVIFGNSSFTASLLKTSNLNCSNGFVINSVASEDYLGSSIAPAGDVNKDGIDDIIVGASNADGTGEAYVIYGAASFPALLEIRF
ncbi:MAG: integrin alpha [Candidatus Midichloria sp.]